MRDARTYTSKDGFATAVFWIQDADGRPFEESRLPRLRAMIQKTLKGEIGEILARHAQVARSGRGGIVEVMRVGSAV